MQLLLPERLYFLKKNPFITLQVHFKSTSYMEKPQMETSYRQTEY